MRIFIKILLTAFALLLFSQLSYASDPQTHEKENKKETAVDSTTHSPEAGMDTALHEEHEHDTAIKSLDEFPNYHPLVVHFPIVLLLIAAIMQAGGFFIKSVGYHRTILGMAVLGYAAAYLAAAWRHPHIDPGMVNAAIQQIFDDHQLYAKWAVWLGGAGAFAKAVELYFERRMVLVVLTTLLLAGSAAAVSLSGHHGAELVHKHGVGTQGNYLKMHEAGH